MIKPLIHSVVVCPDMEMNYPVVTHGCGPFVYDTNGNRYLDAASGSAAVSNIGYGLEELGDVIGCQAKKISVLPAHYASNEILESYLSNLVAFAPKGFSKAWLATSGTEAVENALKLALQYHHIRGDIDRHKIIGRWSSYHGNSIFTLDIGGMHLRRSNYRKWLQDHPHIPAAYSYRRPEGMSNREYSKYCSDSLEKCILDEGPENIAAFIFEPIVGAALGAVPPPDDVYLGEIRRICTKYGVLLIADEVMTGFGRTGYNFAVDRWNVIPDIIAAGKGISGGYIPLSAVIAHEKIVEPFVSGNVPFWGGHTFACYPLGAAVGQWVLDYMHGNSIISRARIAGDYFRSSLEQLRELDCVGDLRGEGLMLGVELVADKLTRNPFPAQLGLSKQIGLAALQRGLILYPGRGSVDGVSGDHILITPPLICSDEHFDWITRTLQKSILDVVES